MRIKKIGIASFGKFKNFELNLDDGFNLIYGGNEDGKSTLMAFISLMLYSDQKAASRGELKIREKYSPWSGEKMSGDMEVESGGRSYRIHKTFGKTIKTDKTSITDTETGEKIDLPPNTEVGKFFLGIDCTAFQKSIFGGTADSFAGEESGDISTRLSNISESGDESISPQTVIKRLEDAKFGLISRRGTNGALAETTNELEMLTMQLSELRTKQQQRSVLKNEYDKIEKELKKLNETAEQIRKSNEIRAKRQRAALIKDFACRKRDYDDKAAALNEKLCGEKAETVLETGKHLAQNIAVAQENLKSFPIDSGDKTAKVSEEKMREYISLSEARTIAEEERTALPAPKKSGILLAFLGALLIIAGIIGTIMLSAFASALSVIGLICCIFFAISQNKAKSQSLMYSQAEQKIADLNRKIEKLLSDCGCATPAEFNAAYRDGIVAAEQLKIRKTAEAALNAAQSEFTAFISKFGCFDIPSGMAFIDIIEQTSRKLEPERKNMESFKKTYNIPDGSAEELLHLAQDIIKELPTEFDFEADGEENASMIREKNARLIELTKQMSALPLDTVETERQIAYLTEKKTEMQAYYNSLCIALEVMNEAADEMSRSFSPQLHSRAAEILQELTEGRYDSVSISKTYEIELKQRGETSYHDQKYLSRGTCAQSYLALRIALCEMLEETDEKIPLMLDDVLADYDSARAEAAANFIEGYAKDGRQVLFFTCHDWSGKTDRKISLS